MPQRLHPPQLCPPQPVGSSGNLQRGVTIFTTPSFILVGGRSSRFGGDKTFHFYRYLLFRLRPQFRQIRLVAKSRKFRGGRFYRERSRRFAPIFPVIELLSRHRKIFLVSGDTPLVGGYQLGRLLRSNRVAAQNPVVGVYLRRRDLGRLRRRARGDLRLRGVAPTLKIPDRLLVNVNRRADLQHLPRRFWGVWHLPESWG